MTRVAVAAGLLIAIASRLASAGPLAVAAPGAPPAPCPNGQISREAAGVPEQKDLHEDLVFAVVLIEGAVLLDRLALEEHAPVVAFVGFEQKIGPASRSLLTGSSSHTSILSANHDFSCCASAMFEVPKRPVIINLLLARWGARSDVATDEVYVEVKLVSRFNGVTTNTLRSTNISKMF